MAGSDGGHEENLSDDKEKFSRLSQACEPAKSRGYTRLLGGTRRLMPARWVVVAVVLVVLSKRESGGRRC